MRPRIITARAITSSSTRLAQRVAPALGQRQVDRAAALVVGHARIAAAFVQGDAPALP
jgi:hypothetical protein